MAVVIGVDAGGTFTDHAAADSTTGRVTILKVPSTLAAPSRALLDGVSSVLARAEVVPKDVRRVSYGTTVATIAMIENKGARAALLVTRGFRYVLDIGRRTFSTRECDGLAVVADEIKLRPGSLPQPRFPSGVALRAPSRILVTNSIFKALEGARRGYGAIVIPHTLTIDIQPTRDLRATLRRTNPVKVTVPEDRS